MSTNKPSIVIGNWKMNPSSLAEAKKLLVGLRSKVASFQTTTIVLAPPAVFLTDLVRLSPSGRIGFAAQSIHSDISGAHTGAISAPMVQSCGAGYVIIGHSERREEGVTDTQIAARFHIAIKHRLVPVVCIGERVRDKSGNFYTVIEQQIACAFAGAKKAEMKRAIIAYEPVWAIGSGQTPSVEDVQEMRLFINKCLTKMFDRATARATKVLYGGSVNPDNVEELCAGGGVDGFLVGGASLQAKSFLCIIKAVEETNL